jgi:hypothetical protein
MIFILMILKWIFNDFLMIFITDFSLDNRFFLVISNVMKATKSIKPVDMITYRQADQAKYFWNNISITVHDSSKSTFLIFFFLYSPQLRIQHNFAYAKLNYRFMKNHAEKRIHFFMFQLLILLFIRFSWNDYLSDLKILTGGENFCFE